MLDCTQIAIQIKNEQSHLVAQMSRLYDEKLEFLKPMADFAEGLFVAGCLRGRDSHGDDPHEPEVCFVLAHAHNIIKVTAPKHEEGLVYRVRTEAFYTDNHDEVYRDFDAAYNAIYALIIREGAEIAYREGQRA